MKPDLLVTRLNFGIALFNQHRDGDDARQFETVLRGASTNQIALAYLSLLQQRQSPRPNPMNPPASTQIRLSPSQLTNEPVMTQHVSRLVRKKEKDLYYLFPGQGHGKRKRFFKHLLVGLVVGLITAALLAVLLYVISES